MKAKYRTWYKIQVISCIFYAVLIFSLYWMIYADSSYTSIIITAAIATVSLITTTTAGLMRAFIGHKMGLKSSKKDWLIVGISLVLVIIYFAIKYL